MPVATHAAPTTSDPEDDTSIVALERFIHATRDSGYRGTASAVAELLDNSLQAGATRIHVAIAPSSGGDSLTLAVLDNGCGMDAATLRQALRFGGSTRFNDRRGLGRYGMGLPNSSLSQARRADVFTWQEKGKVITSYLDVDEIASGAIERVPVARRAHLPPTCPEPPARKGTLVVWSRCDRLDHRRSSTIARKLHAFIGRVFRHYLWSGVEILIDGIQVKPADPLYLHRDSSVRGGQLFGEPLVYSVDVPSTDGTVSHVGSVTVTFSELPVEKWHDLPNEEKRALGITKGAGVSVVRAGREIDYGWFFMGQKRRENYDDWWRCEVKFDAALDELFGITHTKQQVRPREQLLEILSTDMETAAKALNSRIRHAHLRVKARQHFSESEEHAAARDHLLPPVALPTKQNGKPRSAKPKAGPGKQRPREGLKYAIREETLRDRTFFRPEVGAGSLNLVLNRAHSFYRTVFQPLAEGDHHLAKAIRGQFELILLAAARAEALVGRSARDRRLLAQFRETWSDAIATFLAR
jgi:hypothetical protein